MRMRHKKNLEARLEAVSEYLITLRTDNLNFNEAKNEKQLINLEEIFGNSNPVYLEIGGGKGQFACTFAEQNPEVNMLCVEKISDVIVLACEKAQEMGLKNVKFVSCAAEYLEAFLPEKSFETIYLNFSCPFPKKSYASHRLTHERFLNIYKPLLKDGAPIIQKTDNMHFFEFSIEQFSKCGFVISNVSLDLHNSDFEGNIVTEYESRFVAQGMPIYRLEARIK
ncbi:MAG: tRNA (guanosine(46)-N7)-methyltransferase TrmB [Eubacterium sp.]|nr:tRNA (guanosine(46)-N7)-methyltransferase TrmB [Eubacterium sp.]